MGAWKPASAKVDLTGVFPDLANDGQVVNVKTGKAQAFSLDALKKSVYTPPGAASRPATVYVEGANQWLEIGAERTKRQADRLGMPTVVVHNGSLVKESPGQNPLRAKLDRALEYVSTVLLRTDKASEASAKNVGLAMTDAIESGKPAYFSGYSQGSVLVGKAVEQAKARYLERHGGSDAASRSKAEKAFEEKAGKTINIMTFGNVYDGYQKGPNYLHVSMKGDPVLNGGSRPDNRPPNDTTHYVTFDQLFPGKDNFENHNIAFATELLKRTCEMNGVDPGDSKAIFDAAKNGGFAKVAKPSDVAWPKDMAEQLWDPKNDLNAALKASGSK